MGFQAPSSEIGFSCADRLGFGPPNSPQWDFPVDQRAHVNANLGKIKSHQLRVTGLDQYSSQEKNLSHRNIRIELLGWTLWQAQLQRATGFPWKVADNLILI